MTRALHGTCLALALACGGALGQEQYSFDASEFARKPFEIGGYLELQPQFFRLNQDGALYHIDSYAAPRRTVERNTVTLKPWGKVRWGDASLNFRGHLAYRDDSVDSGHERRFDELFASYKPGPELTVDAGKTVFKWGKGYAWNPAGFVERLKDPNDPELAREGFTALSADFIRNFDGPLRTVAFTPVILPVSSAVNRDFGTPGHVNVAGKLYLLYRDTDIDLMILGGGSRSRRYGIDFSRNIASNLEIHGEWARITDVERRATNAAGVARTERFDADSWLLGVRYLTASDATWIVEYYRNGTGFTQARLEDFYRLADNGLAQFRATGNAGLLERAAGFARSGYGRPNPGRSYVYLRVSLKDPFDILYFTPALTTIVNAEDRSFSIAPELLYTGITNVELRLRTFFLRGGAGTDFGEKQNAQRVELTARLYF